MSFQASGERQLAGIVACSGTRAVCSRCRQAYACRLPENSNCTRLIRAGAVFADGGIQGDERFVSRLSQ
jgi:hypothetical protein